VSLRTSSFWIGAILVVTTMVGGAAVRAADDASCPSTVLTFYHAFHGGSVCDRRIVLAATALPDSVSPSSETRKAAKFIPNPDVDNTRVMGVIRRAGVAAAAWQREFDRNWNGIEDGCEASQSHVFAHLKPWCTRRVHWDTLDGRDSTLYACLYPRHLSPGQVIRVRVRNTVHNVPVSVSLFTSSGDTIAIARVIVFDAMTSKYLIDCMPQAVLPSTTVFAQVAVGSDTLYAKLRSLQP